jgi:hypothetical protein
VDEAIDAGLGMNSQLGQREPFRLVFRRRDETQDAGWRIVLLG